MAGDIRTILGFGRLGNTLGAGLRIFWELGFDHLSPPCISPAGSGVLIIFSLDFFFFSNFSRLNAANLFSSSISERVSAGPAKLTKTLVPSLIMIYSHLLIPPLHSFFLHEFLARADLGLRRW